MLHRTAEIYIFLILFIIICVLASGFINQVKYEYIPKNAGLSPDQVIMKELPVKGGDYSYKIIHNSIFVLADDFYIGGKNTNSGFMFIPEDIVHRKQKYYKVHRIPELGYINVYVTRNIKDYAVRIYYVPSFKKSHITTFPVKNQNNEELETIERKHARFWIDAYETIPDNYEIRIHYDDKSFTILDKKSIIEHFGGEE